MIERVLRRVTLLSTGHPRLVITLTAALTVAFAAQFPKITIDTDPKHMLPVTSPVRQYNDQVEKEFALHADVIALGIVNDRGIANATTLSRIVELTGEIRKLPGVISRDVVSLSTIDDVVAQGAELMVRHPLDRIPESAEALEAFRGTLLDNPLFLNRIVSADATATAIYVPIEPTANGKAIADAIRRLLPRNRGDDRYLLAGDPVARDTFGAEMFRQMGLFSPIAGVVMCMALWLMFRSVPLVAANMTVAMVSIIWSMGLLIGLGYPVHIMSSMSPVFLMAIATDSVHVFNEFVFRLPEVGDKRRAVLDTMATVGRPICYSDLTTAAGFAALATATIVPVRIFGLVVGFGTLVILLMSFTLVPAVLVLLRADRLPTATRGPAAGDSSRHAWLSRVGDVCVRRAKAIALAGGVVLLVAIFGLFRIQVNNNMVHWFKPASDVRTADRIMNARLGGTSTAYLVVQGPSEGAIKAPVMLRGIEALQRELERDPRVGKTFSVVDYVKRINRVLHENDRAFDRVPDSATEVGQYLFLFGASAKPSDLDNVVDYPFQKANILLQLKSWDAGVMADVLNRAHGYLAAHPLPGGAIIRPAGIAYFNLVWSNEVLWGMLNSFLVGLALVLVLLVAQTRSLLWGVLSFLPLLFTIAVIYGVVGLVGKDFDMPVAVLSTLSLGLAVDFAIHFVARFQQRYRQQPHLRDALVWTVARPGKGIVFNAVLFALGFAVMIFADLTPYITVGVLMAAIMLLSAVMSIVYLPGLIHLFQAVLLKKEARMNKTRTTVLVSVPLLIGLFAAVPALAYPPAVGILGQAKNCLACHSNNGPWKDDPQLIIDILDKITGKSLRQPDGTFLITARRGEAKTVLTVIGTAKGSSAPSSHRNAWLYVDPLRIGDSSSLSKFAPGWTVNLPMSCRLVGDSLEAYGGAHVSVLPMTVRPGDDARDADIELQVMLTQGESVKNKPLERMLGNYFERKVRLKME